MTGTTPHADSSRPPQSPRSIWQRLSSGPALLCLGLLLTTLVYWSGLSGSWLFDDYPNIVDNHALQPKDTSLGSLLNAALSSPASEFKRPLASLSFAANYLIGGLNPYGMKLTNLLIHLLNGLLVYALGCRLLELLPTATPAKRQGLAPPQLAALIATGWLLLPINLTAVLYVVQRMESLANLFVLGGLCWYLRARRQMQGRTYWGDRLGSLLSLTVPAAFGLLAKETAILLPLYAAVIEWLVFHGRSWDSHRQTPARDRWILGMFGLILLLPMLLGLAWLLPQVLRADTWAARNFTLGMRLLSECRIVADYLAWTLLPTPHALSFYHDDYLVSAGWLKPWTTAFSALLLAALLLACWLLRRRRPRIALGLALYFAAQSLTATILPLELVYEHRNYFASFALLLFVLPWLSELGSGRRRWGLLLLGILLLGWTAQTATTAYAWGDPLRLAEALAARSPDSPRSQYELGRTYIMYSHYDPASPFTQKAYAPLERAAGLKDSSILPQQALIFMNARMDLPLRQSWWDSMIAKLASRRPGVQDESSLLVLTRCAADGDCKLPHNSMEQAYQAALSHQPADARLLASYSDYRWQVLQDHRQGLALSEATVAAAPNEPVYRITLIRRLLAEHQLDTARQQLVLLKAANLGGRFDSEIAGIERDLSTAEATR